MGNESDKSPVTPVGSDSPPPAQGAASAENTAEDTKVERATPSYPRPLPPKGLSPKPLPGLNPLAKTQFPKAPFPKAPPALAKPALGKPPPGKPPLAKAPAPRTIPPKASLTASGELAGRAPKWDDPTRVTPRQALPRAAFRPEQQAGGSAPGAGPMDELGSADMQSVQVDFQAVAGGLKNPDMATTVRMPDSEIAARAHAGMALDDSTPTLGAAPGRFLDDEIMSVRTDSVRGGWWRHLPLLKMVAHKAGPAVLASLATLIISRAIWKQPQGKATTDCVAQATAPRAPAVVPLDPPKTTARNPEPRVAAPAPAVLPAAVAPQGATADCQASFTSTPAGAVVRVDDAEIGTTPTGSAPVPCGEHSVTFTRPRYTIAEQRLELTVGAPGSAHARLTRPKATLDLSSTPPGASLKVNGIAVGKAPQSVSVSRFERAAVEAQWPGRRGWEKQIYVSESTVKVNAQAP